jgi:hypothetical protein
VIIFFRKCLTFFRVDRYPQLYESLAARDYIRWCKELSEFLEQHPERLKQKTPSQTKRKSTVSGWMLYASEMRAKVPNLFHIKIPPIEYSHSYLRFFFSCSDERREDAVKFQRSEQKDR